MDRTNFLLWQNLAWPILRSYRLEGYLTGEKVFPSKFVNQSVEAYEEMAMDGEGRSTGSIRPKRESEFACKNMKHG